LLFELLLLVYELLLLLLLFQMGLLFSVLFWLDNYAN